MDSIWSTVTLFAVMIAVIVGAYYVTKLISNRTPHLAKNKYIRILDRLPVAKDKQILLLEAGGRYFLVGISGQSIQTIGELSREEIHAESEMAEKSAPQGVAGFFINTIRKGKENQEKLREARKEAKTDQGKFSDILEQMTRPHRRENIKSKKEKNNPDDLGMD